MIRYCRHCGQPFTVGPTTKYCPKCSQERRHYTYPFLDEEGKRKHRAYVRHWIQTHPERKRELRARHAKTWKVNHPAEHRLQRSLTKWKDNEETMDFATNRWQPWSSDEDAYLRAVGTQKTVKILALDLGRTYVGVMTHACRLHIPLMTEDKRHGRLTSENC